MTIEMDRDLLSVLAFMQGRVPAPKLLGTAEAVSKLAPLVWGQHEQEAIRAIELVADPICGSPRVAIESSLEQLCVGDGFVAEVRNP
jgi:hypothetical protein